MKYVRLSVPVWTWSVVLILSLTLLGAMMIWRWCVTGPELALAASPGGAPNIEWAVSGHRNKVNKVAFSPDGQILATASQDQTVKLWRVADGALVRTWKSWSGYPIAIAFSPGGETLVVGTEASTQNLFFFRVSDGALLRTVSAHSGGTTGAAITADGALLVSGGRDRTVKIWTMSDGALVNTLNQGSRVQNVAVSLDGQMIAAGSNNGVIKLWRVSDGAPLGSIIGHEDYVFSLAFSADGTRLASGGADESLKLWSIPDGSLIRAMTLPNSGSVTSAAFTGGGQTVIGGTSELLPLPSGTISSIGALRFWRASDGALLLTYDQQTGITVTSISLSPDGSLLSYGLYDGGVVVVRNPF